MSTMSQFFGGGAIKSIQTGYINASMTPGTSNTEDAWSINVTINSVATGKTMLYVFGTAGEEQSSKGRYFASTSFPTSAILPRLTSSTNLRLSARNSEIAARWYVIEFN
jgi:hypothetical protein